MIKTIHILIIFWTIHEHCSKYNWNIYRSQCLSLEIQVGIPTFIEESRTKEIKSLQESSKYLALAVNQKAQSIRCRTGNVLDTRYNKITCMDAVTFLIYLVAFHSQNLCWISTKQAISQYEPSIRPLHMHTVSIQLVVNEVWSQIDASPYLNPVLHSPTFQASIGMDCIIFCCCFPGRKWIQLRVRLSLCCPKS